MKLNSHIPRLTRSIIFVGAASLALLALSPSASAGLLYRWTGPDGQTHYGDTLPPAQSQRGYEVINAATGEVTETVAPAKTQEQLAAEAAAKKAKEKQAAQEAKQRQQDQILLDLYSNVDDIKRARDTRIADIDHQIKQIQNAMKRAEHRAANNSLPKSSRTDAEQDLAAMQQRLKDLQVQHDKVMGQFNADIDRFQQLQK